MAIALIVEGEPVWSGYYGYADRAQKSRITSETRFRTQSISKSVTALAVMRLLDEHKASLDTPITSYLSSWEHPALTDEITLRTLLSHTSGMQLGTIGMRYDPLGPVPPLREALTEEVRLINEPGNSFTYSNVGYNLIELIIEEISSQEFAQFMDQEIFTPLGMEHSTFIWDEQVQAQLATGYTTTGTPVPPFVYPEKASGGLFSTLDDLALCVSAGMTGRAADGQHLLTAEHLQLIHTPVTDITGIYGAVADGYSFGHFTETLDNGNQAIWHGGQGYGWMTHFHSIPGSGDGIVILTNSQRSWPLIARVLREWTDWRDTGPVQMSRITSGVTLMWALVTLLVLTSLLQTGRLIRGLLHDRRTWTPPGRPLKLLQLVSAIAMLAALLWASTRPYLMITSVFPGVSWYAGAAVVLLGVVCIISSALGEHRPEGSL